MDFVNLGAHCSVQYCKQQDFLPFECDGCRLKFCLKHRCYKAHKCKSVPIGRQVITCPLCGKGIPMLPGQDINFLWERHSASPDCKASARLVCSNSACNKVLTDINSVVCSKCNKRNCLVHRFSDSHRCKEIKESKCILF
jgi:AN1-like Zinc finger